MAATPTALFAERGTPAEVEGGLAFSPKFDADGLIPAIVTDAASGEVLMLAWMNAEALATTLETRIGHFWSRSRGQALEEGRGERQRARGERGAHRLRPGRDLAQGAVAGDGVACHTGRAVLLLPCARPGRPARARRPHAARLILFSLCAVAPTGGGAVCLPPRGTRLRQPLILP